MPEAKKDKPQEAMFECPHCGSAAAMAEHADDVQHFGKVLISTLICSKCNFKLSDVMCVDFHEPAVYSVDIKIQKDMETKLVKSSSGTVRIQKLGVSVEPGSAAEGYITNIEGFLDRVESVIEAVVKSKDEEEANEKRLAKKQLRRVQDARKAAFPFKVIVEDPFGNSALIGPKVKKAKLSEEEAAHLKRNIEVLELGE